jgi:hypothetical protein
MEPSFKTKDSGRELYKGLTIVNDEALRRRKVVVATNDPPLAFELSGMSKRTEMYQVRFRSFSWRAFLLPELTSFLDYNNRHFRNCTVVCP